MNSRFFDPAYDWELDPTVVALREQYKRIRDTRAQEIARLRAEQEARDLRAKIRDLGEEPVA